MQTDTDLARGVFRDFYLENRWGGAESRSGKGSSLDRGAFLEQRLPLLLDGLGVRSMLDVPCGDVHWMSRFPLQGIQYLGVDIVPEIIAANRRNHGAMGEFFCLDACRDPLPEADLILCRDLLSHLPNASIRSFLRNICSVHARWLLCGRFLGPLGPQDVNRDISFGKFRAVDLCEPPFDLPAPIVMVPEFIHKWKTLALWPIDTVRRALNQ